MQSTKAVIFTKYGGPLTVGELKLHALKANQVLIKTHSVSLNPVDFKRQEGHVKLILKDTFPAGLCFDVSGVIEQAGSDVKNFAVGDRVCSRSRHSGTLAEYCVVDADVVAKIPENVSFNDAAALPLAGLTAYQSLLRSGLKEGESVFISGGAGGVGSFAVQFAKKVFKAGRVVTTSSGKKIDFCKSLGADEVLDYKSVDPYKTVKGPFDAIFDTVGDASRMGGSLIKPGKYIISIASTPEPSAFDRADVPIGGFLKGILTLASQWNKWMASPGIYNYLWMKPNGEHLQKLIDLVGDGTVKCHIDSTFEGLEKAPEAFDRIKTGHAQGKIVIVVKS